MSLMRCDNCGRIVDTDDDPGVMIEEPWEPDEQIWTSPTSSYTTSRVPDGGMVMTCLGEPCREESDDDE